MKMLHFASPEKAQLWFEWQRHKNFFLAMLIAGVIFFIIGIPALSGSRDPLNSVVFLFGLFEATAWVAFATGLYIAAMNHRDAISGMATFVATRPVSSKVLAQARLKAGLRMILIATTFIATGTAIWLAHATLAGEHSTLTLSVGGEKMSLADALTGIGVSALESILVAWTLLWVGSWLMAIMIGIVMLANWLYWVEPATIDLFAAAAIVTATAWACHRAWKADLIKGIFPLMAVGIVPILAASFVGWKYAEWSILDFTIHCAMLSISIAPFVLVPLTIHRRRSAHGGILQ